MADSGFTPPNRPSRGSGSLTVHLADELDVYFNEVAHGRPVGFVASPKWKPRTDVYETDAELIVHMDIAGMQALAELPRNSSATRVRNRCEVSGRPRGFYRKHRLSRIALRELGSKGLIPGLVKSSW